ncbi:MAG: hypothetical protein JJT88_11875 [Gammaproteobacteria bacterium]|nr:hypothetical protein [Gammaproteobacteria bacterium]
MIHRLLPVVLLAALAVPTFAAGGVSYDYLEAGYTYLDPDDFSSADGFGVGGSLALTSHAHVVADYDRVTGGGAKAHLTRVALGLNSYIDHRSDFIVRVGYAHAKAGSKEHGFLAEAGARIVFGGVLELNSFVTYYDDTLFGDDISLSVGAVYSFSERFGLSARVDASTERTVAQARLRYSF